MSNIGAILRDQGDYPGAISCFEACLAIEKKALGEAHPEVAATIAYVGAVLQDQGD